MIDIIEYEPIGIMRTPFKHPEGTPIQPSGGADVRAIAEVFPEYHEGLEDLNGFSHIILLYHCHLADKAFSLKVSPFLDDSPRGLFATRAPSRPNAIGLSVVRLDRVEGGRLHIRDVDILDGTPLLDIKPYVPRFDVRQVSRTGWFEGLEGRVVAVKDDGRFSKN